MVIHKPHHSQLTDFQVPNAVFKCLEVIGKHREQGLIQPELTAITGQDKKSIAGRTTLLKDLGYIEKVAVLARSMNTSKLTLTKFAIQREQNRAEALKDEKKKKGKNVATGSDRWTGETIHTESLVRAIIAELKAAKNGVVQRGDLKKRLVSPYPVPPEINTKILQGMDKSRFHWRTLSRMLRKVEAFGVWRRIRVPLATNRTYDRKGAKGVTVQAYSRCLKFIRDITNEDWRKLSTSSKLSVEEESEGDEASDIEQGEKDNEDVDVDAINEQLSRVDVDAIQEIPRDLPRWNVYTPTPNIVFNLIQSAEKDGLSSMVCFPKPLTWVSN